MAHPPFPPTYFFVIDVSAEALEKGILNIFVSALKEAIENEVLQGRNNA